MTPLALLILKSNTFRIHVFPCHCLAKTSCHHITLLNLSSFVFLRYLAVQGGFPGHGVPRRGRWVLWFGWLLGSLGLILGEKNEWRNKEMKMPPLLQQARGATVLTYIYDRHTFQFTCCIHKLAHTYTTKCITQAEEEWDFLSSREGESPSWINPCLRVLVPSPSWIGLDSFLFFFFFFLPPLDFEWTQQQVPRFLVAAVPGPKMNFGFTPDIQKIYFPLMHRHVPIPSPFLLCFLSLFFFLFCISFFYW